VPTATKKPEIARLAGELRRQLGDDAITVEVLAEEIFNGDKGARVLAAIEDALGRATAAEEPDALDEMLRGPRPTDEEVIAARRAGQAAVNEALGVALADALSREEAAERLGISPQAVSKRLAAGALVALSRGRARWLPAWQFHDDGVLPGLSDLIAAYPGTALSLTSWATSPSADLGGATPAEAMARRGGPERVVAAAHALTADAW
jgi:hypothetical protein